MYNWKYALSNIVLQHTEKCLLHSDKSQYLSLYNCGVISHYAVSALYKLTTSYTTILQITIFEAWNWYSHAYQIILLWGAITFTFSIPLKNTCLPNIRKACSAFTAFGASSLNTDIISRKSSKVQSPSWLELNIRQILSPNGFTCSSGYWSIFDIGSLAFLLCPTFSGARALNLWCALQVKTNNEMSQYHHNWCIYASHVMYSD